MHCDEKNSLEYENILLVRCVAGGNDGGNVVDTLENMANFVDEGARDGAGSTHGGSIRGSEMEYLRAQVAWYPEVIWT